MEAMRSQLVVPRQGLTMETNIAEAAMACPPKAKEVAPFLRSLRKILDVENPAILRWTVDGKAFEILDMQRMMEVVLPKYFKHGKYTSFQRQLNYFNFRKWTKSKAVVCTFSNPFFVRDQPCLAWRITRKKALHSQQSGSSGSYPEKSQHKTESNGKSKSGGVARPAQSRPQTRTRGALKTERATARATASCGLAVSTSKPIVIKVPAGEASSPSSFPSPTDVYSMENDLDLLQVYGEVAEICFHDQEPASPSEEELLDEQSLDWVDALYSSLEPITGAAACPSFHDHAFEYAEL